MKHFQTDKDARESIAGVMTLSGLAVLGGAEVGDLRWADPDVDFEWIATDNTKVPMDAHTALAFAQAAAQYKSALVLAGRTLKDMATIPETFADDQYWPSSTLSLS